MRKNTYDRFNSLSSNYKGYISTRDLIREGFSNRQILCFQKEGMLEKIANGYFWMSGAGIKKPTDYKAVEVGFVNGNAVIVADSACFYQGFIDVEPKKLSVATRRSDRRLMVFPFEVTRHYLAEDNFKDRLKTVKTNYGSYQIYDIDRSVWDCIRFRDSIESDIFDLIMEKYRSIIDDDRKIKFLEYSKTMKFEERARKLFSL